MVDAIKKDPNGLTRHDVATLRSIFKRKPYSPKHSLADIMYAEGQQKVIDYIEDQLIAKRGQ